MLQEVSKKNVRIVMLGLDGSGKSAILSKLRRTKSRQEVYKPTFGFDRIVTTKNGMTSSIWDSGGSEALQSLWHHYYADAQGIVFVVDSSDPYRSKEARKSLWNALQDSASAKAKFILIYANKQDCLGAMSVREIIHSLRLRTLDQTEREWCVVSSSAYSGKGIDLGINWLSKRTTTKSHSSPITSRFSIEGLSETIQRRSRHYKCRNDIQGWTHTNNLLSLN